MLQYSHFQVHSIETSQIRFNKINGIKGIYETVELYVYVCRVLS